MAFSIFELSNLNGSNGFRLNGINASDNSGSSVSSAGDVNGDGLDDLIIGAFLADPNGSLSGQSYVVFGSSSGFSSSLNLSSLNGSNGFTINGITTGDFSGRSVSSAGDVNGDGIDDLVIGAYGADPNGLSSGQSYVVFGSSTGFSSSLNLSSLNGSNGFVINGINASDRSGFAVSSAGDVNGDGLDDLIIGARLADPNGTNSGQSYVVFGSSTGFSSSFNLSSLNGSNGFVINGINASDQSGFSVSSAGDVNGDGLDDLIIGARGAGLNGIYSGQSYVVFGSSTGFSSSLNLSSLNGSNGFSINGINASDNSGYSASSAGDVNGDGLDDLIIGAPRADLNGPSSGQSYVVFGSSSGFSSTLELSSLNGSNGFILNGIDTEDAAGRLVSSAGDVNGDGIDDLIIGADWADPNGSQSGQSYVVFGSSTGFSSSLNLSSLNGSNGFVINGIAAFDYSSSSVSSAGDVNGDGIDDLVIGARGANPNGFAGAGQSYVVFGAIDGLILNRPLINASSLTRGGITVDLAAGTLIVPNPDFTVTVNGYLNVIGTFVNDTILGSSANNSFKGGAGHDVLSGGAGVDTLNGGSGTDLLMESADLDFTLTNTSLTSDSTDTLLSIEQANLTGGAGNNTLNALSFTVGSVTLNGGGGNDTLFGGSGADTLTGGSGNDSLTGGSGLDLLSETLNVNFTLTNSSLTGNGTDTLASVEQASLTGGSGNNTLNAGAFTLGSVTLSGGVGNDSLTGGSLHDFLDGGSGIDRVVVSGDVNFTLTNTHLTGLGNDTLLGVEQAHLTGGSGDNLLNALAFSLGSVTLNGGSGNDFLGGGSGNDVLIGGSGNDFIDGGFAGLGIDVVQETADVNFVLTNTSLDGNGTDTLANIDRATLTGGSGNNTLNAAAFTLGSVTLNGGAGNDTLTGGSLHDSLDGGSENDSLIGGMGNDSLAGGSGNDSYGIDSSGDSVTESVDEGIDSVFSSVNHTLSANVENLTLTGVATLNGTGNSLDNVLFGNSGINLLKGGGGNDSINGLGDNDTMEGGLGNDSFTVGSVGDVVTENANQGTDLVASSVTYTLGANLENLKLLGTAAINGIGNTLDNEMDGNSNNNLLEGGSGSDTLNGQEGNDTLTGGSGNDSLDGGVGIDRVVESGNVNFTLNNTSLTGNGTDVLVNIEVATLTGGIGNNTLNASAFTVGNVILDGGFGNDTLVGGDGNDQLLGGDGNDIVNGRLGNDSITGGLGMDTITFNTNAVFDVAMGIDILADLTSGSDKILLDKTTFTALNSAAGNGFSIGSEFAVVLNDAAAAASSALIVYSSSTGNLFYNQNGSTAGFGSGAQFADLTGNPTLLASDFVIQA